MRQIDVYRNGVLAGRLTEKSRESYLFRYEDTFFIDPTMPSISLTLPKSQQNYHSDYLFPFFVNMLSEGVNRKLQSNLFKLDENDHFGFLMATARYDTIGAVTVKPIIEP